MTLPTPRASRGASGTETMYALGATRDDTHRPQGEVVMLPTPCAQQSGNTPENHLAKKPGRRQVTDLAILVENDLLVTGGELPEAESPAYLPTPTSRDHKGRNQRDDETCLTGALLPTPNAADGDRGKGPRSEEKLAQTRSGDQRLDRQKGLPDLPRLLPTPAAADSDRRQDYARATREGSGGDDLVTAAVKATNEQRWGKYAPAIRRWETVTRPSPAPTEPNTKGNARLSPSFSEWLMGWPAGWVTEKGLISRNDQLRTIGNGVVPQQAAAALVTLLNIIAQEAA